jgi:hypothetical protein
LSIPRRIGPWGLIDLKHRGGLFALLNAIFILHGAHKGLRWKMIFDWVRSSVAATHLYLLLSYLQYKNIVRIDQDILRELFGQQKSFGITNLRIAHWLTTLFSRGECPNRPRFCGKPSCETKELPRIWRLSFGKFSIRPYFRRVNLGFCRRSVYHD